MTRLAAGLWADAYIRLLSLHNIPAFVVAHGDETAGAILVKLNTLDGQATAFQRVMTMDGSRPWDVLSKGDEAQVDAAIASQRKFDRDIWVIEVEDRLGRHMLDEPGYD